MKDDRSASSDLIARWESLNAQGTRDFLAGRFQAALGSFEAAVDVARDLPSSDTRLATSLNNLGETCRVMGRLLEAQPLLEEALARREMALDARHPHVARSRNNLGFLCETRGQFFEAFQHYRDAFAAMSRAPSDYPVELTSTLMHLARLAGVCGAHEQALRLHQAATDFMGVCVNVDDPETGLHLQISGQIHEMGRRYQQAWQCYRQALEILEKSLGQEHYLLASILAGLGRTLRAREHTMIAERVLQRSLELLEAAFDPPHHEIAGILNSLAELYRVTGRSSLSELLYRRSLKMAEATLGAEHPDVAAVLHNLALLHEERGDSEAAAELHVSVQQIDYTVHLPPAEAFARLSTATIGR